MDFKMSIDYLPIGTIVELNEGEKIMIAGYFVVDGDDETNIYDYCGCTYPDGYDNDAEMYLFDEDQIEKVLFIGYEDDEGKQFRINMAKEIDEAYKDVEIDDKGNDESNDNTEDDDDDIEKQRTEEMKDDNDVNLVAFDEIERL
ncbi:MAG: DUF4176 domain-containing protein [Bacilli bacterium]|nr:DUF4176 domain-containing protein [Bacilli bacterium]